MAHHRHTGHTGRTGHSGLAAEELRALTAMCALALATVLAGACGPVPVDDTGAEGDGGGALDDDGGGALAEDPGDDGSDDGATAAEDDDVFAEDGADDATGTGDAADDAADGSDVVDGADGAGGADTGIAAAAHGTAAFEVTATFATANIGRAYSTRAQVAAAFHRVANGLGAASGPRFIGWQEIGEGDPCGSNCEIEELRARFSASAGWTTRRPLGRKPNGHTERVKEPITSKGAGAPTSTTTAFASPSWAGVSPTRFVTVVHYAEHNLSVVNAHFIAGAYSCKAHVAQRRQYWHDAWNALKAQVASEHARGRNVIVTGDLNRARAANHCNPAWNPASLHPRARVVGGSGIDYVFAVPANGWSFVIAHRPDGSLKRGSIHIGIDGHKAHWVTGRFVSH